MEVLSIAIAAVGSGLLATVITLLVQKHTETKRLKLYIFETLMSHRYLISDKENVEALNKVEVVFHNDNNVRQAWKEFLDEADKGATNIVAGVNINDKYLKLLERIAESIGYKKINWENIKRFYYPTGLSTKITEETLLRKAQLTQASAIANQDTSNGQITPEQFGMQFILKAMESPDGLEKIAKIAEMGKKSNQKWGILYEKDSNIRCRIKEWL